LLFDIIKFCFKRFFKPSRPDQFPDRSFIGAKMKNAKSNNNLEIDAPLVVELIGNYLKDLIDREKTNGVVLGLSGGIDSALLATIAVKALGKDKVKVSFLFDRDSEKSSIANARKIANWLGLELEVIDMSPAMKEKKIYHPFIMRLVPYSARFNRLVQHFYSIVNRENPLSICRIERLNISRFNQDFSRQFPPNFKVVLKGFSRFTIL